MSATTSSSRFHLATDIPIEYQRQIELVVDTPNNQLVFEALYALTKLTIVAQPPLVAVGAGSRTVIVRLHDDILATIFGREAWDGWKKGDADREDPIERASGPIERFTPQERTRIQAWLKPSSDGELPQDRRLLRLVEQLEHDPELASAYRAFTSRTARPTTVLGLEADIERARVEVDRHRLGIGESPTIENMVDPASEVDVPGRIRQRGLILAGYSTTLSLVLDWGRMSGVGDKQALETGKWSSVVDWVFERCDVEGPRSSPGVPVAMIEKQRVSYTTNTMELDHTFELASNERRGVWRVHAFLYSSHLAPLHVTADLEIKTEDARMDDLRAASGMTAMVPTGVKGEADDFPLRNKDNELIFFMPDYELLRGHLPFVANEDHTGSVIDAELPAGFVARSLEQQLGDFDREIENTRALHDYLDKQGEQVASEVAERRIANLQEAKQSLQSDRQDGWQRFELRGAFLSRHPEAESGPLELFGSVRPGPIVAGYQTIEIQIRDFSERVSADHYTFTGGSTTFASALERAFVELCKTYPDGKVAITAEDAALQRVVGFELATSAPWKSFKAHVYAPAVKLAVNLAATALMIFDPVAAGAVMPALIVYNELDNVDDLMTRHANGTLTGTHTVLTLSQIGLDVLPCVHGAAQLSGGTAVAFKVMTVSAQTVVMGLQAFEAAREIQDNSIAAMAERYKELTELAATHNPSDPEIERLRAEIDAGAADIRLATYEQFVSAIGNHAMFLLNSHISRVRSEEEQDPAARIAKQREKMARYVEPDMDHVDARRNTFEHSGVDLHNHFMGNVDPVWFMRVAQERAEAVATDVSKWEPLLRKIASLNDDKLVHKGAPIATRGDSGDAIAQAHVAEERILTLKRERAAAPAEQKAELDRSIDEIARSAVDKALRASDETDFNSSYEVRDELVKKLFGGAEANNEGDIGPRESKLLEHFKGRIEVEARIRRASTLEVAGQKDTKEYKLITRLIREQFAYDDYAEATILRLAQDGLDYTEQSNSVNKLAQRFDEGQLAWLEARLIAKYPALKDAITRIHIDHLTMIGTAHFGTRDAPDQSDIPVRARSSDADFRKEVDLAIDQTARRDVKGLDIAGPEAFRFDDKGKERMLYVVNRLAETARERGTPLVFRPHVGEGVNDVVAGEAYGRDHSRQVTKDGELTHYARAHANIDAVLDVLETYVAQPENRSLGGRLPPELIVRFGHGTHTTPEQAARMAQLGVMVEVNLVSNVQSGAVAANKPTPGEQDTARHGPKPTFDEDLGRPVSFDDHALATLVFNDVEVLLCTDGHSVMTTTMAKEFEFATTIMDDVRADRLAVRISVAQARVMNARGGAVPIPAAAMPAETIEIRYSQMSSDRKGAFDTAVQRFYEAASEYQIRSQAR